MEPLTLEFRRSDNLNRHHRFKDDRTEFGIDFTESTNDGKPESQFRGVDCVRETILEHQTNTTNWVSGQDTLLQCLMEAL